MRMCCVLPTSSKTVSASKPGPQACNPADLFLYVYEPGGKLVSPCAGAARACPRPEADHLDRSGTKKGQAWGLQIKCSTPRAPTPGVPTLSSLRHDRRNTRVSFIGFGEAGRATASAHAGMHRAWTSSRNSRRTSQSRRRSDRGACGRLSRRCRARDGPCHLCRHSRTSVDAARSVALHLNNNPISISIRSPARKETARLLGERAATSTLLRWLPFTRPGTGRPPHRRPHAESLPLLQELEMQLSVLALKPVRRRPSR